MDTEAVAVNLARNDLGTEAEAEDAVYNKDTKDGWLRGTVGPIQQSKLAQGLI